MRDEALKKDYIETLASHHPEQRKALILNMVCYALAILIAGYLSPKKNNHEMHRRQVFERKKIQDEALKERKKFAIQKKEDTAVRYVYDLNFVKIIDSVWKGVQFRQGDRGCR